MRIIINSFIGLAGMLYPVAVYVGIHYFDPRMIAIMLIIVVIIRLAVSFSEKHWSRLLWIVALLYCGFAVWRNDIVTLRYYPVLVNGMMLMIFSWSLLFPPTVVERLARIKHPDLPLDGVRYTRRVTLVWCIFFIINGSMALSTALWGSFEIWSLYNGLIAYGLMGSLMAGEYLVRMKTQKHVQ